MFMTENQAKQKFCPHMRGFIKIESGKLVGGINMLPNGGMTCVGSMCAMWQQVGTHKVQTKEKCGTCKAKEENNTKECVACEGTGYVITQEGIGSCGLVGLASAFQLEKAAVSIEGLVRLVAHQNGIEVGEDGQLKIPTKEPTE